jgi:hypothetical protein
MDLKLEFVFFREMLAFGMDWLRLTLKMSCFLCVQTPWQCFPDSIRWLLRLVRCTLAWSAMKSRLLNFFADACVLFIVSFVSQPSRRDAFCVA